jgi:hypothetical protein
MVTSSPAMKAITRRTRDEMVPRSPLPNSAPAMRRRPKATMTILMSVSTVDIYTANEKRVNIAGSVSVMGMLRQPSMKP